MILEIKAERIRRRTTSGYQFLVELHARPQAAAAGCGWLSASACAVSGCAQHVRTKAFAVHARSSGKRSEAKINSQHSLRNRPIMSCNGNHSPPRMGHAVPVVFTHRNSCDASLQYVSPAAAVVTRRNPPSGRQQQQMWVACTTRLAAFAP